MKFELNAEKAKTQAKNLSAYLATVNRKVSLGNAFEAVAHLYGAKSWNVLSAQLAAESTEQEVSAVAVAKYYYMGNGECVEAVVTATMVSDDHRAETTFDVTRWLLTANEVEILELADIGWFGDYPADEVSGAARSWDPEVEKVYAYLEMANDAKSMFTDDIGFCTTVNDSEALRFLRAFRYPVFLKLALKAAGCSDEIYQVYTKHLDEMDAQCFVESWEELERAWAEDPSVLDWDEASMSEARGVTPCSGVVKGDVKPNTSPASAAETKVLGRADEETGAILVMKPDQKALSVQALRKITNDCEYYLQVVIGISLDSLMDGIDAVNDYAEREIVSAGLLSDLSYEVYRGPLGFEPGNGTVYITVTAGWEPTDSFDED